LQKNNMSWPADIKRTKQRESVISVLENSDSPLSAMEICRQVKTKNNSVWLSTVYRILELFVREGIVTRTDITNKDMAVYELNRHLHRHYAVCLRCKKVIEMNNCPLDNFTPSFSENGFHISGHKIEIYGYCKDCEKKLSDGRKYE